MTRFVIFFTLTGQTISRFIETPSDRAAAVRALLEPVGGKLISYDFMFGEDDGMVVFEVPDSQTAAAISLAVIPPLVFCIAHFAKPMAERALQQSNAEGEAVGFASQVLAASLLVRVFGREAQEPAMQRKIPINTG